MSDEALPEITIDGVEYSACILGPEQFAEPIAMTIANLCDLVAALPDEQFRELIHSPRLKELFETFNSENERTRRFAESEGKRGDYFSAENARLREELAHAERAHNAAIVALNTWWKAACCPDAPGVRDEATRAVHEYYRRAAPYLKERHTR